MTRIRLVALVGPTATGKTALALELAHRVGAEIVSADARQIYRGLDIGTAKPTAAERAIIPHHCLDLVEPTERYDVARYRAAAGAAIAAATRRGRPIVVVGGTGLYVRVLLRGLCDGVAVQPALRRVCATLEARAPGTLARWAARLDPEAAARIHPNDLVRLLRVVEVALGTGQRLSMRQHAHGFRETPYDVEVYGLACPSAVLDRRIAARLDAMLAAGWTDEVAALAARLPDDAPAWRTLGYRELRSAVAGARDMASAMRATALATRRFAKRQRTWFRREPGVTWCDAEHDRDRLLDAGAAFLVANPGDAG